MSTAAGQKLATQVFLSGKSPKVIPCIYHHRLYCSASTFRDGVIAPLLQQRPWSASSSTGYNDVTLRYMSNKPQKKSANNKKEEELSWDEKKSKAKEYRRMLYEKKSGPSGIVENQTRW